jgi:hypothetical protein
MFLGSYDQSDGRLRQIRADLAATQRLAPNHPWVLLSQAADPYPGALELQIGNARNS